MIGGSPEEEAEAKKVFLKHEQWLKDSASTKIESNPESATV